MDPSRGRRWRYRTERGPTIFAPRIFRNPDSAGRSAGGCRAPVIRSAGGVGVPPALIWLAPRQNVAGETPAATVRQIWDGKNHPFDFVDALGRGRLNLPPVGGK